MTRFDVKALIYIQAFIRRYQHSGHITHSMTSRKSLDQLIQMRVYESRCDVLEWLSEDVA